MCALYEPEKGQAFQKYTWRIYVLQTSLPTRWDDSYYKGVSSDLFMYKTIHNYWEVLHPTSPKS